MIPKSKTSDPEFWVEELRPLLDEIGFALRLAVPQAHRFFTEFHKKTVNRPLLSNLIRYHALEYLWSQGFKEAREEGADGWEYRGLPNNGIELVYKGSCIRVRKGVDPPYPNTNAGEDFYQQRLIEEMDDGIITNLLVLFNLDEHLQYDGKLRLMRPIGLNTKRRIVKCEWLTTVEPRVVDPGRVVAPEYIHNQDLPLGEDSGYSEGTSEKTGTDKNSNAD